VAIALPLGITILSAPGLTCKLGTNDKKGCKTDSDCPGGHCTPPADWGPDGLACTPDDTAAPSPPVTVLLSTGTNAVFVYDANNQAGVTIGPGSSCGGAPCVAQLTGQTVSCANLIGGNTTGLKLGGGFPATDSTAGDIATVFQFTAQ